MKHWDVTDVGTAFLLVFDEGDEIGAGVASFAERENIALASFTAIGALSSVELMAFDVDDKIYRTSTKLDEQCELASLVGNLARHAGKPLVHAHLTVGRLDGLAIAGHLKTAAVRPTCELFLHVHRAVAAKHHNERWSLPLHKQEDCRWH